MNGMEMMVRAMGIDPAKLQSDLQSFVDRVMAKLNSIDSRLAAIEERLAIGGNDSK